MRWVLQGLWRTGLASLLIKALHALPARQPRPLPDTAPGSLWQRAARPRARSRHPASKHVSWSWDTSYRNHKSLPGGQGGEAEGSGEKRGVREREKEKRGNSKTMRSKNRCWEGTEQVEKRTHTHTHQEREVREAGKGPPPSLPRCSHSSGLSCFQAFGILAATGISCPRKLAAPWPLGGPSCCSGPCGPLPQSDGVRPPQQVGPLPQPLSSTYRLSPHVPQRPQLVPGSPAHPALLSSHPAPLPSHNTQTSPDAASVQGTIPKQSRAVRTGGVTSSRKGISFHEEWTSGGPARGHQHSRGCF